VRVFFSRARQVSPTFVTLNPHLDMSIEIYGDALVSPQPESYFGNVNSYGPRACYDEGKRAAEALCYGYSDLYDVEIRIARIFNTYGPGMAAPDGRVVSSFISGAMAKTPVMTITGDGSAIRSFQYITDCIAGLVKLMASDYSKPVNIGNDVPCRIDELADVVGRMVAMCRDSNDRASIMYLPKPVDDPVTRQPDISLAKDLLDWRPVVGLEEGLQKTIAWFQSQEENQAPEAIPE
jgi:UDP-glucuronate decarboxylase